MADILLTNDDGYRSIGFLSLLKELSKKFSVIAVAPSKEQSCAGKSISRTKELKLKKVKIENNEIFSINGTPADCVQIGLYNILKRKPRLVISGVNTGANVGHGRILSSGTLGASMEASIDGVKSISSSLYIPPEIKEKADFSDPKNYRIFENATKITLKLVEILYGKEIDSDIDFVSINIPFNATIDSEFEITKPFRNPYGKLFHKKHDRFIHINPMLGFDNLKDGTDLKALYNGKISITPINLELVSNSSLQRLNRTIKRDW